MGKLQNTNNDPGDNPSASAVVRILQHYKSHGSGRLLTHRCLLVGPAIQGHLFNETAVLGAVAHKFPMNPKQRLVTENHPDSFDLERHPYDTGAPYKWNANRQQLK